MPVSSRILSRVGSFGGRGYIRLPESGMIGAEVHSFVKAECILNETDRQDRHGINEQMSFDISIVSHPTDEVLSYFD
jgi:hypothetical protein